MSAPQPPPNPPPRPGGVPPAILLYSLCLVPITAFAAYVVSYGSDEEALEKKLREKYGEDIQQVENRNNAMGQVYQSLIKNPGSSEEQEARLQQVLKGGRGGMKRHEAIDKRFYGTQEGLELRQKQTEEIEKLRAEEKERRKKLKKEKKKKRKKKKEQQEENEEESSSDSSDGENSSNDSSDSEDNGTKKAKKKEAAALAVGALALASAANAKTKEANAEEEEEQREDKDPIEVKTTNPLANVRTKKQKLAEEKKKRKKKKRHKKDKHAGVDVAQIATITAVAGVAAMVGFLLGGSRRQ